MKIGIVLSSTPSYSETFFLSKIEGLKQSGFQVILFAQRNVNDFSLCDVKLAPEVNKRNSLYQFLKIVSVLFSLFVMHFSTFFRFIRLERKEKKSWTQIVKNLYNNSHILKSKLDWVHFGFATIAIESEHVAKAIGAKMAVSLRGYDMDVYPKEHPNCYTSIFKNVDKVHAISNYILRQGYLYGLSEDTPFKIITPAINIDLFKNGNGLSLNSNTFLTVARLHWIKGLEASIKAMSLLKKKVLDFRYTIVGEGQKYKELKDLITKLELTDSVFLVGKKSHQDVVDFMRQSHIYIQYSLSEGFCNAVLEAQAMGCLCVVSDGGALPENVIDNETGWVVPKNNPTQLANELAKVIGLPIEKKQNISKNAMQRAEEAFNLKSQQLAFVDFYKE